MSVNQKVLDAIELLATHSVQKAGYDKTIQAQVLSCEDPTIGKYRCKYQDSIIYAYTTNADVSLSKGAYVYILVPENDMRKEKTIIGTTDKLGINYISSAQGDQAYHIIGNNCVISDDSYYLDIDYATYSYNIYEYGREINYVTLDIAGLQEYLQHSSSLIVGGKIRTNIDSEKQFRGHYGITYALRFRNPEDDTYVIREYTINEDNMIDNPYKLIYDTRQYVIFDIDGENFDRVEYIKIFNSDFPDSSGTGPNSLLTSGEIVISALEITGAVRMSQDEINGLAITFYTPQGTFFTQSATSSDYKTITAQVKVKGKLVSPSQGIEFYWGIEDMSITANNEYYNRYLGRGWKCLNSHNVIDSTADPILVEWIPDKDTYIFPYTQATTRNNNLKVAAIYDGNVLTKQINIENLNASTSFINIQSSNGKNFYYGVGETNLICTIGTQGSLVGVARVDSATTFSGNNAYNNLSYYWAWQNYGSVQEVLDSSSDFVLSVNDNVVTGLQVRKIYKFATFKCTVYNNNVLIGTGSIILSNSSQGQGFSSLLINNGSVVFKYDENGVSPTARSNENPQRIYPLAFTLYDETGAAIDSSNPYNCTVRWGIPITNTMLVDENNTQFIQTDGEYNYYSSQTLSYDIVSRYSASNINNQIKLKVVYKGIAYFTETNFTFTKEGNVGTNGTEYVVKLVPNTLMTNPPEFPMLTKIGNGNIILNYGLNSAQEESTLTGAAQLLKAQLWHNGDLIWAGFAPDLGSSQDGNVTFPSAVEWSILANKYNSTTTDDSDFTINAANGTIQYTYSLTNLNNPTANIIKCAITYKNKIYYGTLPITTAWVTNNSYRVELKKNSGFRYVLYAADGTNPQYSGAYPFEFLCYNNGTDISLESSTTYDVNTVSQIKSMVAGNAATNVNLFIPLTSPYYREGLNKNQFKYKPAPRYDGECVNASINCSYKINGTEIARLRIPIHFLLNKYGFSNLNAWDGNSIQLDNDGGFILAPQMGAGVKNNDNSFTGVLMGEVKTAGKSNSDIGLLGYNSGDRTFFLNSENGSAIFGNKTTSQIIIDPASDNARLYSGDFWKITNYNAQTGLPTSYSQSQYNDAGMLIDLTTPQIVFKDKMFWINSDGSIKAGRQSNGNSYTNNWNFSVDATTGDVQMIGGIKAGKVAGTNSYNFTVDSATGAINSGYNNGSYNFTVDGSGNIVIKGDITANSGYIGGSRGWTIGGNSSYGWIFSGNKSSFNSTNKGVYFGTDGISMYSSNNHKTFEIDLLNNTAYFDGSSLTLGKDTTISWDGYNPTIEDVIGNIINGNSASYITGTFIDGTKIISPTIIADSFEARPKTINTSDPFNTSGHFILQTPRSISGNNVTWQDVLDITYGFDGYRPKVIFETSTYNVYQGYFSFEGGDVLFREGMTLGASGYTNKTFSVYSSKIRLDGGNGDSTFEVNNGRIILKQYYQYYYSQNEISSYHSSLGYNPVVGQLVFVLD